MGWFQWCGIWDYLCIVRLRGISLYLNGSDKNLKMAFSKDVVVAATQFSSMEE